MPFDLICTGRTDNDFQLTADVFPETQPKNLGDSVSKLKKHFPSYVSILLFFRR